jgi:hypothetical protein
MKKTMNALWPRLSALMLLGVVTNPSATGDDRVVESWAEQASVYQCQQCHIEARGGLKGPDVSFSQQNEMRYWLENDKHAIARRRVEPLTIEEVKDQIRAGVPEDWVGESNVLSWRICDKLGFNVKEAAGYEAFRNACLTCHGGYRGDGDNQAFAKKEDGSLSQPGISCNYCHQIGDKPDWVNNHGVQGQDKAWRMLPPDQKAAQGMRDLVNTAAQAQNCYDCHIGNRDKNMFVTHVMYAAGHPPLPGVELETFCSSMPQHWQGESKLYDALKIASFAPRDEYFQKNFPEVYQGDRITTSPPGSVYWNTRKIMVGAVAARLQSVELLVKSTTPERWADYSLYDCAACHHELREPSGRQERGYVGAPGRPRQAEWPAALMNVALLVAGPEIRAKVDASEAKLAAAFAQTPFGEPSVVEPIAIELHAHLIEALTSVQGKAIKPAGAKEIIRRLALTPKDDLLVYDSARQVVWAIQAVTAELDAKGEPLPPALVQKIKDLSEPKTAGVDTVLPAGRQVFIYSSNLNADLERRAAYTPDTLAEKLAVIAKEIATPALPSGSTASIAR